MLADTSTVIKFASGSATALSLVGVFPRVGPGRAVVLNLRSRFFRVASPKSVRIDEVDRLRKLIGRCARDRYVVSVTPFAAVFRLFFFSLR